MRPFGALTLGARAGFALLLLFAPSALVAQGIIIVAPGVTSTAVVAPGGKLTVPVTVYMPTSGGGNLASLSASLARTRR